MPTVERTEPIQSIPKQQIVQPEKVEIIEIASPPPSTETVNSKLEPKPEIEEKVNKSDDNLPKSSHKDERVEDLKPTPPSSSPITNINQKLQDAMSSFFNKFKK